jgi:hypothetical protein
MAAFRRAMGVRHDLLQSEEDFRYLHPGRVVLILLGDLEEADPGLLEAGALSETRELELRADGAPDLPLPDWGRGLGGEVPDDELMEALVTLPEDLQGVAMAEALDQFRHAHLWPDRTHRARAAALAEGVYLPLAARVHPILVRRLTWWTRRVGRRLGQ